jgi:hypothetical protein
MMMTTSEVAEVVSRVTYKPGWRFTVYEGRWEGTHLAITTVVPDAYGGPDLVIDVHSMVPPMRDEAQVHDWLMWRLARIEVHEMREFYRVAGCVYDDPHADGADRDDGGTYRPPVTPLAEGEAEGVASDAVPPHDATRGTLTQSDAPASPMVTRGRPDTEAVLRHVLGG